VKPLERFVQGRTWCSPRD